MTNPVILKTHGDSTQFSTWAVGRKTRFAVKSLDPHNWGGVRIVAGAQGEDLNAVGGGTATIERDWAGHPIHVTNSRNDRSVPVKVWTE